MEFQQSTRTKKFIELAESLVDQGKAANFSDLAEKLEWDKTALSNVRAGRINVPDRVYRKLTEVYDIQTEDQPDWKEIASYFFGLLKNKDQETKEVLTRLGDLEQKLSSSLSNQEYSFAYLVQVGQAVGVKKPSSKHLPQKEGSNRERGKASRV